MKSTPEKNIPLQRKPEENKKDKPLDQLKNRLKIGILIIGIYFIFSILHIGCPIKTLSGISCPGCGMTRALLSVLSMNIKEAFHYHPLFILVPFMIILFLFEAYLKPKYSNTAWYLIILIFLSVYFVRLLFIDNTVVDIDLETSKIYKLYQLINKVRAS